MSTIKRPLHVIHVYSIDSAISLDETFLNRIAGGKFSAVKMYCAVDDMTYDELVRRSLINFDYDLYFKMLNGSEFQIDQAYDYLDEYAKDINAESYGVDLYETKKELFQSI